MGNHQRSFERYHPRPHYGPLFPKLGSSQTHQKLQSLLSQEQVKLQTSNLARKFRRSYGPTEQKPIKYFGKKERGRIQRLTNFLEYPLLSKERVKLRTSNFVRSFLGSIGTKSIKILAK